MMRTNPFLFWSQGGLLLLLILLAGSGCRHESSGSLTGRQAPDFTLALLDGRTVSLGDFKGKPLLLEFWAPWCPGCVKNIPALKRLYALYGDRVNFLASSSECGEKIVGAFVAEQGVPYPVALSTRKLLADYRVSGIPLTVLIDGQGVVRHAHAGQFSAERLEKKIRQLIARQ